MLLLYYMNNNKHFFFAVTGKLSAARVIGSSLTSTTVHKISLETTAASRSRGRALLNPNAVSLAQ